MSCSSPLLSCPSLNSMLYNFILVLSLLSILHCLLLISLVLSLITVSFHCLSYPVTFFPCLVTIVLYSPPRVTFFLVLWHSLFICSYFVLSFSSWYSTSLLLSFMLPLCPVLHQLSHLFSVLVTSSVFFVIFCYLNFPHSLVFFLLFHLAICHFLVALLLMCPPSLVTVAVSFPLFLCCLLCLSLLCCIL